MKKFSLALLTTVFVIAGCGKTETDTGKQGSNEERELAIVEATLDVPEKADANKDVTLSVKVTQNKKNVDDADVKFEIWKEDQKDTSEMIEAESKKDGKYMINHNFSEDGSYFVQSHVTARGMHTMPKSSIQIGEKTTSEHHHEEHGEDHHDAGETHHHGDVEITLDKPEHIHINDKVNLNVKLEKEGSPLKGARVKLEIKLPDAQHPDWVEMKENDKGSYMGNYTFSKKGEYEVQVHIENDEGLHEHTTKKITVE